MTAIDMLVQSLQSSFQHGSEEQTPTVVLWTDKDRLWSPIIPLLQTHFPGLLTLGKYDSNANTGPAIWLRCKLAGTLDTEPLQMPVIYLPGVSRNDFRNPEDAPRWLQPLIELQYRGALWSHANGKDWTPIAFLTNLGLELSSDEGTKSAVQEKLPKLLTSDISSLLAIGRLDAVKIRNLGSDWPAAILNWLEKPTEKRDDWSTFRAACSSLYKFDPESDGATVAAELLAEASDNWLAIWRLFAHAPRRYPNTVQLLTNINPPSEEGLFAPREEGYSRFNETAEENLRKELKKVLKLSPLAAREKINALESEHSKRRQWVWCELGKSQLALSIEQLSLCANATEQSLSASSLDELISRYVSSGWKADLAALKAYAAVPSSDSALLRDVLRLIYLPWIQTAAEKFSELCKEFPLKEKWTQTPNPKSGECILFADGLRFDVATMLQSELKQLGENVEVSHRVSGLPSVTPTAKPAVSPISNQLSGTLDGADFQVTIASTGTTLQMSAFRSLLAANGIQPLEALELGDPDGAAWTEAGAIDSLGHSEGALLARRLPEEVKILAERIQTLLDAGWKTVRVVTDHGWLWMPGGLPKTELPAFLTETRWGRCAALRETATTHLQTVPWHFNPSVQIVVPPGIDCFKSGLEYSHGGLSVQECITPCLLITRGTETEPVTLESVSWSGMRCKVKISSTQEAILDIRTKLADPSSSIAVNKKPFDENGMANVIVSDNHEGLAAFIVVLGSNGQILAKKNTTIGAIQ